MNPKDFAASLARATVDLRAFSDARRESLSRATVMRKTGDMTEVNGYEVPEWETVYIDHPFRVDTGSSGDGGSRGVSIGGVTFEDATGIGEFSAITADLQDDDLIEITAGEWRDDIYRIVAAVRYDQKTARRVPIVEEVRPEEWL